MPNQQGSSLIEILISFTILAVVLLGFDAMQITMLREAKTAYYFCVARQQLANIIERLKVNKNYAYHPLLVAWGQQNSMVLPLGRGRLSGHYPDFNLQIFWGKISEKTCVENIVGQAGCLQLTVNL